MPDPNGTPEPTALYEAETRSGIPYTVRLTEREAKAQGLIPGDDEARRADASGEQADAPAKARGAASNKARSASSK